jgi:hypothetical protein
VQGSGCYVRVLFWVVALGLLPAPASSSGELAAVSRANLCVTEGAIAELPGGQLAVNEAKMRAYVNVAAPQTVEARFTYLGPTAKDVPLGSGAMRRQFGLKLRAQDACNLVYAMWRFEPKAELVVSVKSNPGQHASAECGNRGYANIKPRRSAAVAAPREGSAHTLRAEMRGVEIKVYADEVLVWEGAVGAPVLGSDGPVGMRSDNARLLIELRAPPVSGAPTMPRLGCRVQESE